MLIQLPEGAQAVVYLNDPNGISNQFYENG